MATREILLGDNNVTIPGTAGNPRAFLRLMGRTNPCIIRRRRISPHAKERLGYAARVAPFALRFRGARAAHRYADDADPPRQAPSGLRQQPQCRAGETPRAREV